MLFVCLSLLLSMAACREQSTSEKVEDAVEDVADDVEDAADEITN